MQFCTSNARTTDLLQVQLKYSNTNICCLGIEIKYAGGLTEVVLFFSNLNPN
jgi:hypothetical protein